MVAVVSAASSSVGLNYPSAAFSQKYLELHSATIPNLFGAGEKQVAVCLAKSMSARQSALALINDRYSWRGYGSNHRLPAAPDEATFTIHADDIMVGTITLAADASCGLAVDATFPEEMRAFRERPGARLCELKKFAVATDLRAKEVLAALFHTVFLYGIQRFNSTDLFIEVNPRHVRFYETMLGFKRIGDLRENASVGAPSQLMWLEVSAIRTLIERHAREASTRSLYSYFFTEEQEKKITARLAQIGLEHNARVPQRLDLPARVKSRIKSLRAEIRWRTRGGRWESDKGSQPPH